MRKKTRERRRRERERKWESENVELCRRSVRLLLLHSSPLLCFFLCPLRCCEWVMQCGCLRWRAAFS
jgi:hypothetical protein